MLIVILLQTSLMRGRQFSILIRVYISYWLSSIVDSFPRVIKYKSAIFYNSRGDESLNYQISDFFLQNSHISSAVSGDLPYKLTDIHPVTFYIRRIQDFFLSFTWYKERENINGFMDGRHLIPSEEEGGRLEFRQDGSVVWKVNPLNNTLERNINYR